MIASRLRNLVVFLGLGGLMTASFTLANSTAVAPGSTAARERLSLDAGWRFALGHATDVAKDFEHATGHFSYLAKTGFATGAAARDFDDSSWRTLGLPHDWAVELPFSERGSVSHGYKAIGRNFPEHSVGWYRKKFTIPASDLGRRISVEFDGVFRDAIVWINGHWLGREESGYTSFAHNLTEFLNYGGENVLVVRADASLEEGWFYEGAGIYRHVWLVKTAPLHVARHGTFVTSEISDGAATITVRVTVENERAERTSFVLEHAVLDGDRTLATTRSEELTLASGAHHEFSSPLELADPKLWSLDTPHLHTLVTTIRAGGTIVDRYETTFGIRSIHFDPQRGFFLNGQHVPLNGANNHQDHAGVGAALPDGLQEFRVAEMKKYGMNVYRASHNPPTPELLEACDRLGMLVIDENRLMGTAEYHLAQLDALIRRDRNHPSVILWSLGNEEWGIEGDIVGARITATMQERVKRLDPTRPVMVALSGGWGRGISSVVEVAGMNYLDNLRKAGFTPDEWHAQHPQQPFVGSEECALFNTRGVYFDAREHCHLRAYDWDPSDWGSSLEEAWTIYAERPYLAGLILWTGFDYRGEPTPFGWPAIGSQYGVLDLCGFPKDSAFYLQAWWRDEPVLHVFPHWNWAGREGQVIDVWAYSNCDEVELFLNGRSQGRRTMARNSHLEWPVEYTPGTLVAHGYKNGQQILTTTIETTGAPATIQLEPHRKSLRPDRNDVAMVTVRVLDHEARAVPNAGDEIVFALSGPGRIIGVGNGDPSSHEPDVYLGDAVWQRRLFNGLAQVIVQSTGEPGEIVLTARSGGLTEGVLKIPVQNQ